MNTPRENRGHALAALGAAGLVASLWLPWYSFTLPPAALDTLAQTAQQLGPLGSLVTRGAQLLSELGPLHVTGWQALKTTPVVLLVIGIIAGGLSVLALTERATNTARLTILLAIVGSLLVGYRVAVPPVQADFVHPTWGIYVALVSGLVMLAGGMVAGSEGARALPNLPLPEMSVDLGGQGAAASGWSTQSVSPPTP